MPLLKKKALEKAPMPEFLRDDEEVFHCEMTNEIFRDYEEFAERTILCNSMVWSCSMTGKSNLTYVEALRSEENAKKSLKDFPIELRIPVLFLASKTKRSGFTDMAEDVFFYVKDRYFVGENVEACFSGNKWREYHVLQVIGPTVENMKKAPKMNGTTSERQFSPCPSLYKYDLEQLDNDDEDVIEKMIAGFTQIRRKKGAYTREKNKLFLKQYAEQNSDGLWVVKESTLDLFGVNRVKFDQIFDGPLPDFETSKKVKNTVNGKKVRQETLAKYLTKNNLADSKEHRVTLIEELKKKEEEFKRQKEELKQKNAEIREKKKVESSKITSLYKKWCKPKEDLELEDQKKLPDITEMKTKVPDKYVGDMLMVLEFVNSFSKILLKKDYFPGGFTVEIMERALIENEVAGPLIDLIQMLLNALFTLQEEESSQVKIQYENFRGPLKVSENPSINDCIKYATIAANWSKKHHGVPLSKLPMYSLTVSEILRLHLLSSGARINEISAKWRYQQRGGYRSEDDPGLYIRQHQPYLIKALSIHNIVQFSVGDKLKIISCLIDQLLTYADIRDVIEDRMEVSRQHKTELKTAQLAEKRRCAEFVSMKSKLKGDSTIDRKDVIAELEKMDKDNEQQVAEHMKKASKLMNAFAEHQVLLGYDRAFRRYLRLESVPGLFVDPFEENVGTCLNEIVHQKAELIDADRKKVLAYFRNMSDEMNTSDKENDSNKVSKVNGATSTLAHEISMCKELLLCSAEVNNCPVHYIKKDATLGFLSSKEQLDELIDSLNKRGHRESELQQVLQSVYKNMTQLIIMTPNALDLDIREARKGKTRYDDANLGYPASTDTVHILHSALTENILEMEEKIFVGNLGSLKVKDRHEWRKCLNDSTYDNFDKTIVRPVEVSTKEENSEDKDSQENTPDMGRQNINIDHDESLTVTLGIGSEDYSDENSHQAKLNLTEKQKVAIECLSIALVQVAYAVDSKFLKRPLGHAEMKKGEIKKIGAVCDVLKQWEAALLSSTSYSQVFLHYGTLDSCILWSRSALLARCRVCRRQTDSENMLLCDNCNYGQHMYCIKPKLDSIPQGEWFCIKCLKDKEKETRRLNPEPKKKKRRIFRDEDIDEEEEVITMAVVEKAMEAADKLSDEEMSVTTDESSEEEEIVVPKPYLCTTCSSGGDLMLCEKCLNSYHVECVQPPLRRKPRGQWTCGNCKDKRTHRDNDSDSSVEVSTSSRRSGRREAEDLPLHNAALHDLLADVMKNIDAWPFIRPVQKNEVPDYYDVITKPMDFGTIKYKLNMGNYTCDEEFMADAVLIFENCNTYNDTDAEVYKCGVRLLKHFEKKSKELGLKLPEEMQPDDDNDPRQPKNKKRRAK